ncbi:hypothetical protein QYF61_010202 [Mycteria americana]|uniref:Uncharacterized protein n=1 Tax=Mycteria americana TaxID=33587 RepID=A0AAN7P469_MYCAM|nr:hypothetical protein QYF61_010202 [Mycteria americana]
MFLRFPLCFLLVYDGVAQKLRATSICVWQSVEVPGDWRKANVTSVFKKSKKENPGNYGLVSFTLIPGMVMEQLIPETTSRHMKDKKVVGNSQHGFMKVKSCLTNLITFYSDASLQTIRNWEKWLMPQVIGLPFRGTWTGWRRGSERNLLKFNKRKRQALPLGRNNPMHKYKLGG